MSSGTIAIGADHAGYVFKEQLKVYLDEREIPYKDFGCFTADRVDYPDIAAEVAKAIQKGECQQGILVCGSGIGMAISANRFKGIRAFVCDQLLSAQMSRRHNNANIICFGARTIAVEHAHEMLEVFWNTAFEAGRHTGRVSKIDTVASGDPTPC